MDATHLDLAVVIPVFNEEESITTCIDSWVETLSSMQLSYLLIIIDDGSWDKTPVILSQIDSSEEIRVISKHNEGHGPTILHGYREACEIADWVLQVDSDNEIPTSAFTDMWALRLNNDAVLGCRENRTQTIVRKTISKIAAFMNLILFNCRFADPNVPFRLLNSETLSLIISRIPRKTFAPNIIISGALSQLEKKVAEHPVPFTSRSHGKSSLSDSKAFIHSCRAAIQITRISRLFP